LRTISSSGLAPRILRSLQRSATSVKAHLKHLSQCNMTLSQQKKKYGSKISFSFILTVNGSTCITIKFKVNTTIFSA